MVEKHYTSDITITYGGKKRVNLKKIETYNLLKLSRNMFSFFSGGGRYNGLEWHWMRLFTWKYTRCGNWMGNWDITVGMNSGNSGNLGHGICPCLLGYTGKTEIEWDIHCEWINMPVSTQTVCAMVKRWTGTFRLGHLVAGTPIKFFSYHGDHASNPRLRTRK